MSAPEKKRNYIRTFILLGVVFLFVVILAVTLMVIEWKKSGFVDPMNVLLLVGGISGFVICFLTVKLLIRMRKRGNL